jgi:hypothetical protein
MSIACKISQPKNNLQTLPERRSQIEYSNALQKLLIIFIRKHDVGPRSHNIILHDAAIAERVDGCGTLLQTIAMLHILSRVENFKLACYYSVQAKKQGIMLI